MYDFAASTGMGDFLPPKSGGRAISMVLVGGSQKEKDAKMLTQRRAPALRKRPTSQPTPRELLGQKRSPIWLGSATKYEHIQVPEISQCLTEGIEYNEAAQSIERLEAAAKEHETLKKYVAAAESLEQAFLQRQKVCTPESESVLAAAESCCCLFNYWGMQCLGAGQYTASLEILKKAEAFTDLAFVPNYKRRVSLRAVTFGNLCCYFRARGKTNAALGFAEKAIRIEQRYKDSEDPARMRLNYAVLLSAMARHDEAVESIEAAVALIREMMQAEEKPVVTQEGLTTALVVAYHNLWVEHGRRAMHELGASCLLRATNVAKQNLGNDHALTLKMEHSLTTVKHLIPTKAPSSLDDDDLDLYGVTSRSPSSGGQLPALTPLPPKTSTPMQLPQRPATVAGHATHTRPSLHHGRSFGSKPPMPVSARSGKKMAGDYKGSPLHSDDEAEYDESRLEFQRSSSPRERNVRSSSSTPLAPVAPRPPSSARVNPSPRPQPRSSEQRFTGRASSVRGQTHGIDRADSVEPMQLPPRPATVAEHRPRRLDDTFDDDEATTWPVSQFGVQRRPRTRQSDGAAEAQDVQRQLMHSSSDEESMMRGDQPAVSPGSARASERPTAYWMPTGGMVSAADRVHARHREHFAKNIVAAELAKDEWHNRKVQTLLQARDVRRGKSGIGNNKRKEAWSIVHSARQVYVENGAAVRIQKCWRGYITRHTVQEEIARIAHETATQLQSLFRRYCVIQMLKGRQQAAMTIQAHWRRYSIAHRQSDTFRSKILVKRLVVGSTTRTKLYKKILAAIFFQRIIRGFNVRNQLRFRHIMRTKIQKVVRGTAWRRRLWRETMAQKTIAARWRGCRCRADMAARYEGATRFQTLYRKYKARCRIATLLRAGRKIAAVWRSYQVRAMMSHASKARSIQAWFRGILTRKRLQHWQPSARRIQRVWRKHQKYARFRTQMAIAMVLQKHARRHLAILALAEIDQVVVNCQKISRGFYWRRRLRHTDKNVLQIQTFWRGTVARMQVAEMQEKATQIQKMTRMVSASAALQRHRNAANFIRAAWIGYHVRAKLQKLRDAHSSIARIYRGHMCRRDLYAREFAAARIQHQWQRYRGSKTWQCRWDAAVKIQAMGKAWVCRRRFLKFRNKATVRIQSRWREYVRRQKYLTGRSLARTLQAKLRGAKGRALVRRRCNAAASIQRVWRNVHSLRKLATLCAAATRIQANVLRFLTRQHWKRQQESAIHIQRVLRGCRCRWHEKRRAAAVKINAFMKGRCYRIQYLRKRQAALVFQKFWRGRRAFRHYQRVQASVQRILKERRMRKVYKRFAAGFGKFHLAALQIQTCWRRKLAWIKREQKRLAAVRIQQCARRWLILRRLSKCADLSIKLQAHCRRKIDQDRLTRKRDLQSMVCRLKRCYDAEIYTGLLKDSSCIIGSSAEKYLTITDLALRDAASVEIQRIARGYLARKRVHLLRDIAPLAMQCLWRVIKAREEVERRRARAVQQELKGEFFHEQRSARKQDAAALRLQTYFRMYKARQDYRSSVRPAVLKIQADMRMAVEKRRHSQKMMAIVHIQNQLRRYFTPQMQLRRKAARRIQHAYRQHRIWHNPECCDYVRKVRAATTIQALWRSRLQRREFLRKRSAACRIQAAVRTAIVKKMRYKRFSAALRIQSSLVRPFLCKRRVEERRRKVLTLQAFARCILAKTRLRRRQLAALRIQALWRRFKSRQKLHKVQKSAATKIQAYFRMWRRMESGPAPIAHVRRRAAIKVQALVRGYLVRRHMKVQKNAARAIQRKVRLRRFRKAMANTRWLFSSLQRIWRSRSERQTTKDRLDQLRKVPGICRGVTYRTRLSPEQRKAAMTIQRVLRGGWCRQRLKSRHRAAIVLQSQWRMYSAKQRLHRMKVSRRKIGDMIFRYQWRTEMRETVTLNVKLRRVFHHFLPHSRARRMRQKILLLQRVYRGRLSRTMLADQMAAAAAIQSGMHVAKARMRAAARMRAVWILQARLDSWRKRRIYQRHRGQIVMLQAHVRGMLARKAVTEMRMGASYVERLFKGHRVRKQLNVRAKASSVIGRSVRAWLICAQYRRLLASVRQIQMAWRITSAYRYVKRRRLAATQIATAWKSYRCQYQWKRVRSAGSSIVTAVWMWKHMRRKNQIVVASTRIASAWRGYCVRVNQYHLRTCADKLRKWWRDRRVCEESMWAFVDVLIAKRNTRLEYVEKYAILIQRNFRRWRRWRHGMYLVKKMVLSMQSRYRTWEPKRNVAAYRAYVGPDVRRLPSQLVALVLDKRGKLTRYRAFRMKERVSAHSARIVRLKILPVGLRYDLEQVALRIQGYVLYKQWKRKIVDCQRFARGYLARYRLRRRHAAARVLQKWWRSRLQGPHDQETDFQINRRKIIKLQANTRGHLARRRNGRKGQNQQDKQELTPDTVTAEAIRHEVTAEDDQGNVGDSQSLQQPDVKKAPESP